MADNLSGRHVVLDEQQRWQLALANTPGAAFYRSWYLGASAALTTFNEADGEDGSSLMLTVGNHFSPHWRWEVSAGQQQLDNAADGSVGWLSASIDWLPLSPDREFGLWLRAAASMLHSDEDDRAALGLSGDARPVGGLGVQWRDDRWVLRLAAERHGDEQDLLSASFIGYLGGKPGTLAELTSVDAAEPVETQVAPAPDPVAAAVPETPVDAGEQPVADLADCRKQAHVVALPSVFFAEGADQLDARQQRELGQIGRSLEGRHYILAELTVGAEDPGLGERRMQSVLEAIDPIAALRREGRLLPAKATRSGIELRIYDYRPCL